MPFEEATAPLLLHAQAVDKGHIRRLVSVLNDAATTIQGARFVSSYEKQIKFAGALAYYIACSVGGIGHYEGTIVKNDSLVAVFNSQSGRRHWLSRLLTFIAGTPEEGLLRGCGATGSGGRTLGEEEVDLMPVLARPEGAPGTIVGMAPSSSTGQNVPMSPPLSLRATPLPPRRRMLLAVLRVVLIPLLRMTLSTLLSWARSHGDEHTRTSTRRTRPGTKKSYIKAIADALDADAIVSLIESFHLGLFFLFQNYLSLPMRLSQVHFLSLTPRFQKAYTQGSLFQPFFQIGLMLTIENLYEVFSLLVHLYQTVRTVYQHNASVRRRNLSDRQETSTSDAETDDDDQSSESAQEADELSDASSRCMLCLRRLHRPASTPCGHIYCWSCITKWIITKRNQGSQRRHPAGQEEHDGNQAPSVSCPLCREPCTLQSLVPLFNFKCAE